MIYLRLFKPEDQWLISEFPKIWGKQSAMRAAHATNADGVGNQLGQIFVVCYASTHRVIGITGYFTSSGADRETAYLRWTGILPEWRGQQLFREIINDLCLLILGANPDVNTLIELVPDTEHGRQNVMPAFLALGFKVDNRVHVPATESVDNDMVPMVLDIKDFAGF